MSSRTTIEQRELVLKHFQNGHSQRKIAAMVNLKASTVQKIIERFIHENRIHNKGRKAPNKIFNEHDELHILTKIRANPKLSAAQLASEIEAELGKQCCAETVRRVLRQHDFYGRTQNEIKAEQEPEPKSKPNTTNELMKLATERLKTPSDTCQQIANVWGLKLSKMDRMQRIVAERLINEIMFGAELGLLNMNTGLSNIGIVYNINTSPTLTEPKQEIITVENNNIFGM